MNAEVISVPVANLETCDRVRVRHQRPRDGSELVLEYAEAYQCGLITEPLDVFREKGAERYVVADGENRLLALRRAKIKEVECRVHEGDEIDALDFATACNQKHGLRRTKADIVHALTRILETPRLRSKYRTDTELSEHLGISIASVKRYKALWRDSDDGDARVRAKKGKSRERADKHKSDKSVNGSTEPFQETEKPSEIPKTARIEPAVATREIPSEPRHSEPPVPTVSQAVISSFVRGVASLQDVPRGDYLREALSGTVPREHIEYAYGVLSDVLEGGS